MARKPPNPWTKSMLKMGKQLPICPICGGKGNAKAGMFDPRLGARASLKMVVCQKCKGQGCLL